MAPSTDRIKVNHVIVDSGGWIADAPIHDLADKVYSIRDVVGEIKDKATRQRLQVLPYAIEFREPSSESLSFANSFAKKTGDYRSLSAVDVKLIALAHQLAKEKSGGAALRSEPPKKPQSVVLPVRRNDAQDAGIAGFYLEEKQPVGREKGRDEPVGRKKKVVDDLVLSLEKLKEAVEEVKTDFSSSAGKDRSVAVELTTESVYSSFNYWRDPLPALDLLGEDGGGGLAKSPISRTTPSIRPTRLQTNFGADSETAPSKAAPLDAPTPDFDDFLFWKQEMLLSPEDIDELLMNDSNDASVGGKISSFDSTDAATDSPAGPHVSEPKRDISRLLEGRVVEGGAEDTSDDEEDDAETPKESSFEGGWITPSNLAAVKGRAGDDEALPAAPVEVACLTTDFAVQNVLIQMGVNVIGVNGKLIKRARSYALRCYGCFKLTFDQEKRFCPHCGNETLKRVSIKVEEDGSLQYFISLRKKISTKGKNQTLPPPKGGKHSTDPIVFEDQRVPHNRPSKMAQKATVNALEADYAARDSPFATHDVTSRAALLGTNRRSGGGGAGRSGGGGKGGKKRRR